jgi:hypothetical protein
VVNLIADHDLGEFAVGHPTSDRQYPLSSAQ